MYSMGTNLGLIIMTACKMNGELKNKPHLCGTSREIWDRALTTRITQLQERLTRYNDVDMNARLYKLLPEIQARIEYYTSKLYANQSAEHQAIIDRMKPPGRVWARARSNWDF